MVDQISGQIDLQGVFAGQAPTTDTMRRAVRAPASEFRAERLCAVFGKPNLTDSPRASRQGDALASALLDAWERDGTSIGLRLRGDYAIVIVDWKQRMAWLAVDRFAIRPLCYRIDGSTLSFSDRADHVAGRSGRLDAQALFDYLFFHAIPAPRTVFEDVVRVPAANAVRVDINGASRSRHWALRFDEHRSPDFGDSRLTLRKLIQEALSEACAGQERVGAFLSGGTDSSTVTGMLGQVTGRPAPAYSIGFEAEGYDEMEYARLSARHFGAEHHEYYVTPADLLASIPAIAQHHDQPFGNSSALPAYYCAKMAREDGCTLMLAGDGGDELFGGNKRYAVQQFLQYYHGLPVALRKAIEPYCTDDSVLRKIPGLRQMTGYVRHSKDPLPDRLQKMNLVMILDPDLLLTERLRARVDLDEPAHHMRTTWDECDADSVINRMLAFDWRYTLADSDLPKVRGASDMAGIPVAYPLLDDAIVDFSMELPSDWKLRRFKLRWFFKEALRGFLPDAVITKKKQGFGLPHGQWMTRHENLRQLARESLHGLADRGLVRSSFVDPLLDQRLPEAPGYYGEMVWILMMLEQWLRGQSGIKLPD